MESNFLEQYNEFLKVLKIIFKDEETQNILSDIEMIDDKMKIENGKLFYNSFTDENFDLFCNKKIKVFSNKNETTKIISESLFGENLSLRNLLNNQPDDLKNLIWEKLHNLYLSYYDIEPIFKERAKILRDILKLNKPSKKFDIRQMLDVDINKDTDDLLCDIAGSFDGILTGESKTNPFSHIMNITKDITNRYGSKIDNGDIEVEKLMNSITKKVPGMDGFMDKMGGFKGMESMFKNMGPKKKKEKVIINENFSTADVKVEDKTNEKNIMENIKIGNVLKMVEGFNTMLPQNEENNNNPENNSQEPEFNKIFNIFQKIGNVKNEDDANDIKLDLENFLQNDLGIDKNTMNQQFEEMSKTLNDFNNQESMNELVSNVADNMNKLNEIIKDS